MSFPRYAKYKDSGVDWLGEVPVDWQVLPLKHLASLKGRLGWQGLRADEYTEDGPFLVTSEHFANDKIDWQRCYHVSPERYAIAPEIQLRPGDLLMMKDGAAMGKLAYVDNLPGPACLNSHLLLFRPRNGQFFNRFLYYVLGAPSFVTYMVKERTGTTFFGISQESIGAFPFALPPIDQQRQVIDFLDRETAKIDALVGEQRRLIELLKEKRQAVISHAVTKGLNPHAPMRPSGIEWLGDVPNSWTVTKLGRSAFMQEGPGLRHWQFTDEGTRVICVTNITENGIDFSRLEKFISTEEYLSSYSHFTVRSGDVLLSSSGNSWGKVAIFEGDERVILNTSTIRLNESEGSPLIRDYLAILLQSNTVREQLGLAMTGSCQPNFGPTHLNSVMVAVPSRREQSEMVAFVGVETAKLDTLTAEAQRAIDLLQERRTALISAAVTGKIDVRWLAESEAA